jgi:AcrR family transcriptional regulator
MGRPREHNEQTATALLDAAERTMAEQGADALSLRVLARDAGTTTRAVYSLFGSKEGLLGALGVRAMQILQEGVEALPATRDPGHDLVEAALVFRSFALEHPALFSIAFHRVDPAIWPRFRTAAADALAVLYQRFEPLADGDLLGGRAFAEAVLQFHSLCEGLAAVELRGMWLEVDAEKMWRDAVHALVTGFADPPPASKAS